MPSAPQIFQSETVEDGIEPGIETVVCRLEGVSTFYDNQVVKVRGWATCDLAADVTSVIARIRRNSITGPIIGNPITVQRAAGIGGGAPQLTVHSFAFSDAGINAGKAIHTPVDGEILLNAWLRVTTAFNGTTPFADVGTFVGGNTGLFGGVAAHPIDLTQVDFAAPGLGVNIGLSGPASSGLHDLDNATTLLEAAGVATPFDIGLKTGVTDLHVAPRVLPAAFSTLDPVKVVVSRTGQAGGTAVGGTTGAGAVFLLTVVPVNGSDFAAEATTSIEVDVMDALGGITDGTYVLTLEGPGGTDGSDVNGVLVEARVD